MSINKADLRQLLLDLLTNDEEFRLQVKQILEETLSTKNDITVLKESIDKSFESYLEQIQKTLRLLDTRIEAVQIAVYEELKSLNQTLKKK